MPDGVGTTGAAATGVPASEGPDAVGGVALEASMEAAPPEVGVPPEPALGASGAGAERVAASAMPTGGHAAANSDRQPAEERFLPVGAALGVAVGPMALIGQAAAGTGDGHWYVGVIAAVLGALTGGFGLPVLLRPSATGFSLEAASARPLTPAFGAVFLFAVGLLAGAVAAFPMGAVVASVAGLVAGPAAVLAWRVSGGRVAVAAAASLGVGTGVAWWISP